MPCIGTKRLHWGPKNHCYKFQIEANRFQDPASLSGSICSHIQTILKARLVWVVSLGFMDFMRSAMAKSSLARNLARIPLVNPMVSRHVKSCSVLEYLQQLLHHFLVNARALSMEEEHAKLTLASVFSILTAPTHAPPKATQGDAESWPEMDTNSSTCMQNIEIHRNSDYPYPKFTKPTGYGIESVY